MIYYSFVIDYLFCLITPFNSYLITNQFEKNKLIDVIIISLLIDLLFCKPPINVLILVFLFYFQKIIRFNKKYYYIKDIILFTIYYNISFLVVDFDIDRYIICYFVGLGINIFYSLMMRRGHIIT